MGQNSFWRRGQRYVCVGLLVLALLSWRPTKAAAAPLVELNTWKWLPQFEGMSLPPPYSESNGAGGTTTFYELGATAILGNKLFVQGGSGRKYNPDGSYYYPKTNKLQIYDASTKTWSLGSDGPVSTGGHKMFSLDRGDLGIQKLYLLWGNTLHEYDVPTDTWRAIPLPNNDDAENAHVAVLTSVDDGRLHPRVVVMDLNGSDKAAYAYNPVYGTWTTLATPPAEMPDMGNMPFAVDGYSRIYVVQTAGTNKATYRYHFYGNFWERLPDPPSLPNGAVPLVTANAIYLYTFNAASQSVTELYRLPFGSTTWERVEYRPYPAPVLNVWSLNGVQNGLIFVTYRPFQFFTDISAPSVSVRIEDIDNRVNVPDVTLTVTISENDKVEYLRISNDDFQTEVRIQNPGSGTLRIPWTLIPGVGAKKVSVVAVDRAGNVSVPASDGTTLIYDDAAPTVYLTVNHGKQEADKDFVSVEVKAQDNATPLERLQMRMILNGSVTYTLQGGKWQQAPTGAWGPFNAFPPEFPIGSNGGPRTFLLQVRDETGNVGNATATVTRLTAQTAPQATAQIGGGGATPGSVYTRDGTVTLTFLDVNATEYRVSADGGKTWSEALPIAPTVTVTLDRPGRSTILLQVRHAGGSWSVPYAYTAVYDVSPPKVEASWADGRTISSGSAPATIVVSDDVTPQEQLQVSVDGGATWQTFSPVVTVPLSGSGYRTVPVLVRDQAGNIGRTTLRIFVK